MKFSRQNYFVILGIFLPFYPPNSRKNENIKNEKKTLEISSSYTSVPKIMIIRYAVPEMWRETDVIVIFILGNFYPFTPPPPITPKNGNFKKVKKNKQAKQRKAWRYHYFTQVYKKSWSYATLFLRYMVRDGCNCYFSFWAIFALLSP